MKTGVDRHTYGANDPDRNVVFPPNLRKFYISTASRIFISIALSYLYFLKRHYLLLSQDSSYSIIKQILF